MEFRVLGPLEVLGSDGRPLDVGGGRERAVLAALCTSPGVVVPADRLVELVWGDAPPDNPANALQARISGLRRVLGRDRIRTAKPGYALVLDRDELDAGMFEDLIAQAGDRAAADPATAEAVCAKALAMWRGEPLVELDDTSLVSLMTRWSELRRRAIALRATCLVELGRAAEGAVVAAPGFDEDPLDEAMTSVAMTALHRAGRQAEALRMGQRHRVALAEAGLDVGPLIAATERELIDPAAGRNLGRVPPPFYGNRCIGRASELAVAERAIAGHRLTTLTGPGGVGKTRLARELALRHPGWWCDLSVVPAASNLPAALCAQLRIRPEQGASADDAMVIALQHESGLLVLDSCDDLTESVARLVSGLLSSCPGVDVLASSRQPLAVPGEQLIEISPLSTGAESAAADLFVDRARSITEVTDADRSAVERIVARLEGLPLAIELAAGRLAVLGVDELLAHLDARIGHLSTSAPALPHRHRSLVSVVEGSWSQLGERTRHLASSVGVFQGWFTVADAAAVTRSDPTECAAAVDELRRVSLLQADGRRPSPRFRYLAPVREFVWARTVEDGDARQLHSDHAAWVADGLNRARSAHRGPAEAASVDAVGDLRPEILAALGRAGSTQRAALLAPLAELMAMRLTVEDAAELTAAVERLGVDDPWVLAGAAQAAFVSGDLQRSGTLCRKVEEQASSGVSVPWLVRWVHGSIPMFTGDAAASRRRFEASLEAVSDPWERAFLRTAVAFSAANNGDDDAAALASDTVATARELGNPTCLSWALCAFGAALTEDDPAAALDAHEEALALALAVANQVTAGLARPRIAALRSRPSTGSMPRALAAELDEWQRRGNRSHAAELVALAMPVLVAAQDHRTVAVLVGAVGDAAGFGLQLPSERDRIATAVATARAELGARGFAAARVEGGRMGVDAAVTLARSALRHIARES